MACITPVQKKLVMSHIVIPCSHHQWTFGKILPHFIVRLLSVRQKLKILEDDIKPNIFWTQKFFWAQIYFWTQPFFRAQHFFWPNIFLDPTFFWTQHFFLDSTFFRTQNFLWAQFFWIKYFCTPKIFTRPKIS